MKRYVIKFMWINGTIERVWKRQDKIIMFTTKTEADNYIARLKRMDGRLIFRTEIVFIS